MILCVLVSDFYVSGISVSDWGLSLVVNLCFLMGACVCFGFWFSDFGFEFVVRGGVC